jgi:hypothetical protein
MNAGSWRGKHVKTEADSPIKVPIRQHILKAQYAKLSLLYIKLGKISHYRPGQEVGAPRISR